MENTRRDFLKIAGITALGLSAPPVLNTLASSGGEGTPQAELGHDEKALKAGRWAMVIDTRKLDSKEKVEHIIDACHTTHNVPKQEIKRHEIKWIWEEEFKHAFVGDDHEFINERVKHLPFLVLCNHCQNPACVRACPTKATFQRADGIVMMDFHRCIGCRFCMAACPYGSRSFNFLDPLVTKKKHPEFPPNLKFPRRMKGVVEKCNFCYERLAMGQQPACVEASEGGLIFGDLDNAESEVRKLLKENYAIRRKASLGTGPSVYYIV